MKRLLVAVIIMFFTVNAVAVDIWMDVDTAIAEAPVNLMPLVSDSDFKTIDADVNYDVAGLALIWHFVTTAGAYSQTAVTPTNTGGNYDWVEQGNGVFTIEIPASGGASINNDTEGHGWFTGVATGILPWRGPIVGFRKAGINNALIDTGALYDNVEAGQHYYVPQDVDSTLFLHLVDSVDGTPETGKAFGDTTVTYSNITDGSTASAYTDAAETWVEIGTTTGDYKLVIGADEFAAAAKTYMVKVAVTGCRTEYIIVHTEIPVENHYSNISTAAESGTAAQSAIETAGLTTARLEALDLIATIKTILEYVRDSAL